MSDNVVIRPKADAKKIHSKNEFELCYIRHQYFRKTDRNPTKEEMEPYEKIAKHLAKNTFFTYYNLFKLIGFECDDVINVARVHLVSFLGLFSLEKMPEKYKEFTETLQRVRYQSEPTSEDVLNKNKANFTLFLKQRMEDVVRVCKQKARNVKGLPTEEFLVYYGPKRPPKYVHDLVENYERLGFKKMDAAVFRSIKKKVRADSLMFKFEKNWYICIPLEQRSLGLSDFVGADMNPYDNFHNMTPEEALFAHEEDKLFTLYKEQFDSYPKHRKLRLIREFVKVNQNKANFKDEVRAARKLLRDMEA